MAGKKKQSEDKKEEIKKIIDAEKLNVLLLGTSGAGKSTLINTYVDTDKEKAPTGTGEATTHSINVYGDLSDLPFRMIDTPGLEYNHKRQSAIVKVLRKWLKDSVKNPDPKTVIHTIWFCVDGQQKKFSKDTLDYIRTVTKFWEGKGKASEVTFLNTRTGELFHLTYNPSEMSTQTVSQKPDNVLELEKKGSNSTYKYVFDAKYRIEMEPDAFYPDINPGPKTDDINTMHRYRDSIVYENPESRFTFEKTMFGAYILFPYDKEDEYKEHHFYKSIEKVNIGGLPFLPSATSLVTDLLEELVSDSPESAFERTTLPKGIEERIRTVEWNKRAVLIGLVEDENLDWCLENKMYVTRKFDIANLPIRYIALYERGKGIEKYGEVISWTKTTTKGLPENGMHSGEEVHVFKVLKWIELDRPIRIAEYGPNPISYTNEFLLFNSATYPELMLKSEADYRFFTELKRRTDEAVIKDSDETTAFEFGETKVLFDKSDIYVYANDKQIDKCTVWEFSKHPNATFRRIQRYAEMISAKGN